MQMGPEKRKKMKEMIAVEIRSYLDRYKPTSKYASFEIADWDPMLEDVMYVIENENPVPKREAK